MARLVIIRGPGTGRDLTLGAETVVGRAPDVELTVDDAGASRRHCRVRVEGAGFVVEDLGSRNGTFVNGQRAQLALLAEGDVIRVGTVELIFRADGVAAPAPARAAVPVAPALPRPTVAVPARPAAAGGAPTVPGTPPAAPGPKKYDINPVRRRPR